MFRMIGYGENIGSVFPSILKVWKEERWAEPELTERQDLNEVHLMLKIALDTQSSDNMESSSISSDKSSDNLESSSKSSENGPETVQKPTGNRPETSQKTSQQNLFRYGYFAHLSLLKSNILCIFAIETFK